MVVWRSSTVALWRRWFTTCFSAAGDQSEPAIAAARQGPAVVVWVQKLVPGGRADIFARVLSPNR